MEFLNIEICVEVSVNENEYDTDTIASTIKKIVPRIGETIWMPYDWERKNEFGTRAFIVKDICHHILNKAKYSYDQVVVFVEPIKNK